MRNLRKYGLGFQVEANTNCMNLAFVFQDHELTVKPRTSFQATLSLYMNLDENSAKVEVGGFSWITLCSGCDKITILEPISMGLHPWRLNQIKNSVQIHIGWSCEISQFSLPMASISHTQIIKLAFFRVEGHSYKKFNAGKNPNTYVQNQPKYMLHIYNTLIILKANKVTKVYIAFSSNAEEYSMTSKYIYHVMNHTILWKSFYSYS